jgi:hypothetical protein
MMLTNLFFSISHSNGLMKDSKPIFQKGKWSKFCLLICLCSNLNLISNALTSENMSHSNFAFSLTFHIKLIKISCYVH